MLVGTKEDLYNPDSYECVSSQLANTTKERLQAYASLQCSAKEFAETEELSVGVNIVFKTAIRCGLRRGGGYPGTIKRKKGRDSRICCTLF